MSKEEEQAGSTPASRALLGALLLAAVLLSAVWASLAPVPTVDTWIALACGRHIDAHGVSTVEPFSHSSRPAADGSGGLLARLHPSGWINQNWLTHLLFFWLVRLAGLDALVAWKVVMVALTAAVVWLAAHFLGVRSVLASGAAIGAVLVGRSFLDIRPQMFSNVMTALLFLVLVLASRRSARHAWWVVPLVALWANLHGGFIAAFIFLVVAALGQLVGRLLGTQSDPMSGAELRRWLAVGLAAVAVSVVLSPFHLANLTHPLEISLAEEAQLWRSVGEWHPAWELANPVGNSLPFLLLAGILAATLAVWWWLWRHPPSPGRRKRKVVKAAPPKWWPRLQPSLVLVVLAATGLALKSRRFIPMAALVICPLLAALVEEAWAMARTRRGRSAGGGLRPWLRRCLVAAGVLGVLAVTASWTAGVYRHYIAPWPAGAARDSLFFRMTGSHHRPFEACDFLSANSVSGRAFTFWADGGFLAWCQEPDPDSGRLPVSIFIDGRAQAAYDLEHYMTYLNLRGGGPLGAALASRGRAASGPQSRQLADWLTDQLRARDVTLVIAPEEEYHTPMVQALGNDWRWKPVYVDDRQMIFADNGSPQGQRLQAAVLNGEARFPDTESRDLTLATGLSRSADAAENRRALELALGALERAPTQTAVLTALAATRSPALAERAGQAISTYVDDFAGRREQLRQEPGLLPRLEAAIVGVRHVQQTAAASGQQEQAAQLAGRLADYEAELSRILERIR